MKLAQLDRHPDYSQGLGPVGMCLQWLDTLTKSASVAWNVEQHKAARQCLKDAHELMLSDVALLTGRQVLALGSGVGAAVQRRETVLAAIALAEDETIAAIRAQEARDKYAEPQAPAEHGERLEAALRAARAPIGSGGTGEGATCEPCGTANCAEHGVPVLGPVEHDPLLQLMGNRCLCARCVKDRQEAQA